MEEEPSEFRHWDELIPETLGLIFSNLTLKQLLTIIPCVCKSWREVVIAPYCWQEIDIEEWIWCYLRHTGHVDRMLRMLITRSRGSLRNLHVASLEDDTLFSFITDNAGSLRALRLPGGRMSASIVEQTAHRLSTITLLDLSRCSTIGAPALEAIGKHCKLLVTLYRKMSQLALDSQVTHDDEANAIAATMPRLKHLEVSHLRLSTGSVVNILYGCPQLEFLDLKGCWGVKLENGFLHEKFPKLKILGPGVANLDEWESDEWSESTGGFENYTDNCENCDESVCVCDGCLDSPNCSVDYDRRSV